MFFQILTNIPTVLKISDDLILSFNYRFFKSTVNLYFKYLNTDFFLITHKTFHRYLIKRPILRCYERVHIQFFHHKWYFGQSFQVKNSFVPRRETLFPSRRTSFRTRHSTVRLLPVSILSSSVVHLLPCCFNADGFSFSIL